MNRFLSSQTKKIDAKGRVSVPANFRAVMTRLGIEELYGFRDFVFPAFSLGGPEILDRYERQMASADPLSDDADNLSLLVHGGGSLMRLDGEGRLAITDSMRQAAGFSEEVTFVGRADHFQLWEPKTFEAAQERAREERTRMRMARPIRDGETG